MKIKTERKNTMPVIRSVEFYYTGSDKQFNDFLKAVVRDYIANDRVTSGGILTLDDKNMLD